MEVCQSTHKFISAEVLFLFELASIFPWRKMCENNRPKKNMNFEDITPWIETFIGIFSKTTVLLADRIRQNCDLLLTSEATRWTLPSTVREWREEVTNLDGHMPPRNEGRDHLREVLYLLLWPSELAYQMPWRNLSSCSRVVDILKCFLPKINQEVFWACSPRTP